MKKGELSTLLYMLAIVGGVIWIVRAAKSWWFLLLFFFVVAPAFGWIGWAIGKEEEPIEDPNTALNTV